MKKHKFNLLMIAGLLALLGLACNLKADSEPKADNSIQAEEKRETSGQATQKLESYEIKGFKFAFYKIKADLSRDELIKTAKEIHEQEADTQLVLVDDDTKVSEYISYAKAVSSGKTDQEMPKDWADKHIVANVQKYMNGRWVLCEGYGYTEIADLK